MATVPDFAPVIPEIVGVVAAMALLMVGVFQREDGPAAVISVSRRVTLLGLASLAVVFLLVVFAVATPARSFGGLFIVDDYAIFLKAFILIASALTLVMAGQYLESREIARFEYPVLVLIATVGMMMMVSANDLISLYLGLEMQSLALYVMAAFHRDELRSTEAGLKYFVLGSVASALLLYGSSMVYGTIGATGFDAIAAVIDGIEGAPPVGLVIGLVFVLAGLAFKVSAVPFHMWAPDVYEGSPTPVTAFFSVAPKLAAVGLLLRVMLGPFADLFDQWQQIVVVISVASMVLGAFAAIGQRNIKRLMAYSSITHVGYALVGLAAGTEAGVQSVIVYMVIYVFMNIGAFCCILSMRRRDAMVEGIDDLAGMAKSHPRMALALAIFMFAMAGIPPLAGFFGKLYVFLAAINAGLYSLAVIGLLASVFAAYYYIRIVKIMYFDEPKEPLDRHVGLSLKVVMYGSGVLIVLFFLLPGPLLDGAAAAASSLFVG